MKTRKGLLYLIIITITCMGVLFAFAYKCTNKIDYNGYMINNVEEV